MIGKGPKNKGAVWVAQRIPDDCITAHANQARITTFPLMTGPVVVFGGCHRICSGKGLL